MGQFDAKDRPFRNLDVLCQVLDSLGYLWLSLITIVTTKDAKEVRIDVEFGGLSAKKVQQDKHGVK